MSLGSGAWLDGLWCALAKLDSEDEVSLSFAAANHSSHFRLLSDPWAHSQHSQRKEGRCEEEEEDEEVEARAGPRHSCIHTPSLQPAPTAPLWCANSGKTNSQIDNTGKYLIVPDVTSPSLLRIECLTLVTSGTRWAGREHTQPCLEQGEQAAGHGGGTVPRSLMPPAQPPPFPCRAWLVAAQEQLLPAQTHLLWLREASQELQ